MILSHRAGCPSEPQESRKLVSIPSQSCNDPASSHSYPGKVGRSFIDRVLTGPDLPDARIRAFCHHRVLPESDRLSVVKGSIANREDIAAALEGVTHVLHLATCKETPGKKSEVVPQRVSKVEESDRRVRRVSLRDRTPRPSLPRIPNLSGVLCRALVVPGLLDQFLEVDLRSPAKEEFCLGVVEPGAVKIGDKLDGGQSA